MSNFIIILIIFLSGCTQYQRFTISLHSELDSCAMKIMSESKFNSQSGYLQAHYDCHRKINIKRFNKHKILYNENNYISSLINNKNELENELDCWAFVKRLVLVDLTNDNTIISKIKNKELLLIRDKMQTSSIIGKDTSCTPSGYNKLTTIIGREVRRRYPEGVEVVDGNYVGNFK